MMIFNRILRPEIIRAIGAVENEISGWEGVKLGVVNTAFKRISFPKALRNLSKVLSSAVLLLGYLSILMDKGRQGWHDMIAGCYVVKYFQ